MQFKTLRLEDWLKEYARLLAVPFEAPTTANATRFGPTSVTDQITNVNRNSRTENLVTFAASLRRDRSG